MRYRTDYTNVSVVAAAARPAPAAVTARKFGCILCFGSKHRQQFFRLLRVAFRANDLVYFDAGGIKQFLKLLMTLLTAKFIDGHRTL
jgi:hypothetical protein